MTNLINVVENLERDLMKSVRGNKDKISVKNNAIYIEVSIMEIFAKSYAELCYIVPLTIYNLNMKDINITVTNGIDENYITFK